MAKTKTQRNKRRDAEYNAARVAYMDRKLTPLVQQIESTEPMTLTQIRAEMRRIGEMDYCGTYRVGKVLTACGWCRRAGTHKGKQRDWWYPPR